MNRITRIEQVLRDNLNVSDLHIEDFSHEHAGRASETHLKIRIISTDFESKNTVKRHRLIYSLLQSELDSGLHAVQIQALTPEHVGESPLSTPKCKGG